MRYIALLILVSACSTHPFFKGARIDKHLRKSDQHLAKAIALGAKIDTVTVTNWDTLRITSVRDSLIHTRTIDTVVFRELCPEASSPDQVARIVCPEVRQDTSYTLSIMTKDGVYHLPVRVRVMAEGSSLSHHVEVGELKVPVRETVKVAERGNRQLSDPASWWLLLIGFVLGLATIIFLRWITR